jgi:hypothetical protein
MVALPTQSTTFDGAVWLNGASVLTRAAALGWEMMRTAPIIASP